MTLLLQMAKQSLKRRETEVATDNGIGKQTEQTLTVEDSLIPSPQEIAEYKKIDPKIVEHLLSAAQKEQDFRHEKERSKLKIVKSSENRIGKMNWWGMFFAFLALIAIISLSAYALYLNRPWFAGIFGFSAVISIVSLFVNAGSKNMKQ